MRYFDFCNPTRMYTDALPELFGRSPRDPGAQIEPFHQDLACSLQRVLEEILIEKVRYLHGERPSDNLCLAGGVALNCVANGRIRRAGPFKSLFIQPAAGDSGAALGAAAVAHVRMTGAALCERQTHAYLGPDFSSEAIFETLNETPVGFADYRGRERELIAATARSIVSGLTVGWYQGRMEFGPRALGARSILADPRHPGMRDRINQQIKQREMFRPFAPAVLESKVSEYFDMDYASPFMLEVGNVTSSIPLPAVTHVDGSARVQTVAADVAPRFAALLAELKRLSGCAVVLNTSFNMNDEPIVCTPLDALRCFAGSGLGLLVLGDFIIERSGLPDFWAAYLPLWQPQMAGSKDGGGHDVYSFF
jgi:carbamoyltransferase